VEEVIEMQDLLMIAIAAGFAATSWLLIVLSDHLMGGNP
jgi:hypothetical protein